MFRKRYTFLRGCTRLRIGEKQEESAKTKLERISGILKILINARLRLGFGWRRLVCGHGCSLLGYASQVLPLVDCTASCAR
jgi:hypothetical protein